MERAGEGEAPEWRRGRRKRFTALRRSDYLEVLERTGNARAAAEAIGISRNRLRAMRRREPGFDRDCAEAEAAATRRLAGVKGPFDGVEDGNFETIRRRRDGRVQIIAVGPGRWSKKIEDRFFAALAACGNIDASARAVGFAGTDMHRRRRQWPAFARRMDEMLEDAELRLELLLASTGNKWVQAEGAGGAGPGAGTGDAGAAAASREGAREAVPFDPEFALRFLKWREEKRRAQGGGGARSSASAARRQAVEDMPIEAVREEILRRIDAIRAHEARREAGGGDSEVTVPEKEGGTVLPDTESDAERVAGIPRPL
ncbi:MAG TPA: hypothetical protein VGC56_13090 [Allosphingosinicella sp.]